MKVRRMQDAEFISELIIAYFNGHQNKKQKIDYYYELYEEKFDEGDNIKNLFNTVVGEILQILPEIKKTRWRNMTDFYTLFLVLSQFRSQMPFSSNIRDALSLKLIQFGEDVSTLQKALKEDTYGVEPNTSIANYSAGIRASTDLGSRKLRFESLDNIIRPIIE